MCGERRDEVCRVWVGGNDIGSVVSEGEWSWEA